MNHSDKTMEMIVNRGFVYPGSEIYGGLAIPGTTALWAWSSKTM